MVLPPYLSNEAKSFITLLLQKNPLERLGSKSILDIINHPFFKDIDWDVLRLQETPLPLVTSVSSDICSPINQRNYFDTFSYYVDGTDRQAQKRQVKQFLTAWLHSDITATVFESMAPMCYGQIPYRGMRNDVNGYFRFMSKSEFLQHCQNELSVCPEITNNLKSMTVRMEESTILFEGERCTCQWRSWGFE